MNRANMLIKFQKTLPKILNVVAMQTCENCLKGKINIGRYRHELLTYFHCFAN